MPAACRPTAPSTLTRFDVPRGGTVPIRDPAALALLGTPFDNFAYTADVKPAVDDARAHQPAEPRDLPVAAGRLPAAPDRSRWPRASPISARSRRAGALRASASTCIRSTCRCACSTPAARDSCSAGTSGGVVAPLTEPDAVPGPDARRAPHQRHAEAGHPDAYVQVDFFDDAPTPPAGFDLGDVGLHLFLPQSRAAAAVRRRTDAGSIRGDNLCAWETGLRRPLRDGEIVIDPDIGRVLIGVGNRGAGATRWSLPQARASRRASS